MATPMGATFVIVRPAKAVELKDGFAQRVLPESSLHALTSEVLDKSTGMRSDETFSTQVFAHAAVGIAQPQEGAAPKVSQTHCEEDLSVVVVGYVTNSQELRELHLPDEIGEMNDAAIVGKLYSKMQKYKAKYAFVSELEGEFAFALYCAKTDNLLAGRSPCGKYMLSQGVDKKTGGLVVTNALLTNGHEITEIPAGNFIFGKFRERNLHPMHKETTAEVSHLWRPTESSHRKSLDGPTSTQATQPSRRSMDGSYSRRAASLDLPHADQREAAFAAASRAMAGLEIRRPSSDSAEPVASTSLLLASEIPAAPKGRTTPSAKGTADRHATWRRSSLEFIKEEKEMDTTHTATHPCRRSLPSHPTTTPSAKGTADSVDSWRKSPPRASLDASLDTWTPVAIGSFLYDMPDEDEPGPVSHAPASSPPERQPNAASTQNPLDYAVKEVHTELLSKALDEFMDSGALPRPSSIERCAGMDVSQRSYEDLLTLSRLSGNSRSGSGGVQIKSQKVNKRTSYKKVKEGAMGENTAIAGSPNCGVTSATKRFLAHF